jgi:peptide/nickel transport system substrate-binding protein
MFVGMYIAQDSPFTDRRVRQALNYGVNAVQIVDDLFAGYGKRYGSWVVPPNNNMALEPWPYDPGKARELLAEAGYKDGFTTTLRTPSEVYYRDVATAQAIAQQLGEIGVTVKVEVVEWDTHLRDLLSDDPPPLFLLAMNSRGNELEDLRALSSDFAFNPTGWQNESFEETLGRASQNFNDNARSRLLGEAQAIAYEDAPCIWLWRKHRFYRIDPDLDWTPRPDGLVYLYQPKTSSAETKE